MRVSSRAAATLSLVLAACAQPGAPPGGPEDRLAPEVAAILPESGAVGAVPGRVRFQFDEVVSERPQNVAGLAKLFLISPRHGEPRVSWRRREITVRPRDGWRPNTTYTVTMLPGLTDLRGNVRRAGSVTVFSTGGAIPATRVNGTVFEWSTGKIVPRALIEAIAADSTTYVTISDSAGTFSLNHVPPGVYLLRAAIDANSNRAVDAREAFDSTRVTLADLVRVEFAAFVHDTLGPRISTVVIADSVTLRVTFDKPVDVTQDVTAESFALIGSDSAPHPIARAAFARRLVTSRDSVRRDSVARADSIRNAARRDTFPDPDPTPAVPLPARVARDTTPVPSMSRPLPEVEVVVTLARPLAAQSAYRLRAIDIRNLMGVPRTSERVFTTPRPKTPADSTARDTTRATPPAAAPPRP